MKRVFHKSKSFKEAEEWDLVQHARMTLEQRLKASDELKKRVYGDDVQRIRKVRVERGSRAVGNGKDLKVENR